MLSLKRILLANAPLKIVSLILGYTFWYIFGHAHTITTTIRVPVSFYGTPSNMIIHAPETIMLELSGKRSALRTLDTHMLAIHVNAEQLHAGPNPLILSSQSIFLPEYIKLVNYTPSNIVIDVSYSTSASSEDRNSTA